MKQEEGPFSDDPVSFVICPLYALQAVIVLFR
jgi:hypothetical protein